jgi:predicted Zn-dependent protease
MNSMLAKKTIAAALTAISITAGSAPAFACGGEWYPIMQIDPRIQGVDKAEDKLDDGHTLAAAGSVIRMIPHIKTLSPTKTKLIQRANRVLAVAVARYDGALPVGREVPEFVQGTWLGKTAADRSANLEWATKTLRAVAAARNDDPAAKTELAEVLARVDSTKAEARTILEELAAKDLITSADGYKTLATLRESAGDAEGKRAAIERCKTMAHGDVCEAKSIST